MQVRRAAVGDLRRIEELYRAFFAEVAASPTTIDVDLDEELVEVAEIVDAETAFVAEENGGAGGICAHAPS